MMSLNQLPNEMLDYIFGFLSNRDCYSIGMTNKNMLAIVLKKIKPKILAERKLLFKEMDSLHKEYHEQEKKIEQMIYNHSLSRHYLYGELAAMNFEQEALNNIIKEIDEMKKYIDSNNKKKSAVEKFSRLTWTKQLSKNRV